MGAHGVTRRGTHSGDRLRVGTPRRLQAVCLHRLIAPMKPTERGRVVILAGGKGKRLAPYTFVIPKPIVPIGTTPILEIVLRQMARDGFRQVTIALGHMSEIIKAVAGDGSRFDVEIE